MAKPETKNTHDILVPEEVVMNQIFLIRDQKVMLDRDLAALYGVETKALNQAVKRNLARFPIEFRFQLSNSEKNELVTNCYRLENLKHTSTNPYVFTGQGVAMLSAILRSDIAIKVSIQIMNAFVKLREMLYNNTELRLEIEQIKIALEKQNKKMNNQDKNIELVFQYLDELAEKKNKYLPKGHELVMRLAERKIAKY